MSSQTFAWLEAHALGSLPVRWTSYSWLLLAGIGVSLLVWTVLAKRILASRRSALVFVYFGGLGGAFLGAKIAFLLAEGWAYRTDTAALLSGKSITGALLGGYVGVEAAKAFVGVRSYTGDWFAIVVPLGVALGRIGCLIQGCCAGLACRDSWWAWHDAAGVPHWPAQALELGFHITFAGWAVVAAFRQWMPHNRFHVYLIAYGLFRFLSEFGRSRVQLLGLFGGYHIIAAVLVVAGLVLYLRRRAALSLPITRVRARAASDSRAPA